MREMLKMVVVLAILSSFSGGLLAFLKDGTKDRIENQELELVKGPAVRSILDGCLNDPVSDRIKITDGDTQRSIFVGIFGDVANTVAFEVFGNGFADKFGMIVGVNTNNDKIVGVGITTHKETPGLGANAKDDPKFVAQFKEIDISSNNIMVTNDGGQINALSGATITSRAVCAALVNAGKKYSELKPQFTEKLKTFTIEN